MVVNPFVNGFKNNTHVVREHRTMKGNFLVVSCGMTNVLVRGRPAVRAHVWVTLFGRGWSESDVDRADRNGRYLEAGASIDQAREVRDALARDGLGFDLA